MVPRPDPQNIPHVRNRTDGLTTLLLQDRWTGATDPVGERMATTSTCYNRWTQGILLASTFFIGRNLSGLMIYSFTPMPSAHVKSEWRAASLAGSWRPNPKTLGVNLAAFTTRSTDHQCLDNANVGDRRKDEQTGFFTPLGDAIR
jgi:hypothetical protein